MRPTRIRDKTMKKILGAAITILLLGAGTFAITSNNEVQATASKGYGDGHCTKCGLKNGKYRCEAFWPKKGQPTTCHCGHSKSSHSYRR